MRDVLAIRLGDDERAQVQAAAARLELTLSGFVREAALEASARVTRRVSVQASEPPEAPERESRTDRSEHGTVVLVDPEEGSHAFVDGICKRCGVDVDGRESPCTLAAVS
jgi:hypothetical protein